MTQHSFRRRRQTTPCLVWLVVYIYQRSRILIPFSFALSRQTILSKRSAQNVLSVERSLVDRGITSIIGSDESGTGCIAGPIVCCSVCIRSDLQDYQILSGVNDCKVLDADARQAIHQHLMDNPQTYSVTVAVRDNQQIDNADAQSVTLDAFRETIEAIVEKGGENVTFYSIVDGIRSPKHLSIPSRPMKQADATVYTVALASVVARVTRDTLMSAYTAQYPQYGFDRNGGYPTRDHVEAIHLYGPSPIHRRSTKPVKGRDNEHERVVMSRRSTLMSFMVAAFTLRQIWEHPRSAMAMTTDPKTGIALPEVGEIESAIPRDWSIIDNPFDSSDAKARLFGRLDSSNDSKFYQDPRFVEHVDPQAVESMTTYVSKTIAGAESVLDLCTSWTSHIRPTANQPQPLPRRVAGLGMNRQELDKNLVLTERIIQDLNERPVLPFLDAAFDVVLCQLSIDYLTEPLAVCKEIGRVLKTGGSVHILFSNRLFLQKAVAVWTGADDIDHCFTVASYLYFCDGGLENVQAIDLSTRKRKGRIIGDPLYVVTATKA